MKYNHKNEWLNSQKECFVITPVGPDDSELYKQMNGIISAAIEPVLEKYNFKMVASHLSDESGLIRSEIVRSLKESDLVIANLTGNNPNVMYEVALRHAFIKPIILITDNIKKIPFDISDNRAIKYENSMAGSIDLKKELENKILGIACNPEKVNNPVTNTFSEVEITSDTLKNANKIEKIDLEDAIKTIFQKVDNVTRKLDDLENRGFFQESNSILMNSEDIQELKKQINHTIKKTVQKIRVSCDKAIKIEEEKRLIILKALRKEFIKREMNVIDLFQNQNDFIISLESHHHVYDLDTVKIIKDIFNDNGFTSVKISSSNI